MTVNFKVVSVFTGSVHIVVTRQEAFKPGRDKAIVPSCRDGKIFTRVEKTESRGLGVLGSLCSLSRARE